MKNFFLSLVAIIVTVLLFAYFAFLFYLPKAVNLNTYLPMLQQIAKEQADVDLLVENPEIITTVNLQAGIKTGKIIVKLPDGSVLVSADGLKTRISLPSLLLMTVKVTCAELTSPKINLEIQNGEQFKVVQLVEDIMNRQKNTPPVETSEKAISVDPSFIKIKVPNLKLTNYNAVIDDLKSGHKLTLHGEDLTGGYFNGKTVRLKTTAELMSDNLKNIKANIDIDTFLPAPKPADPDDDPVEKILLPFVNPVVIYRDYNLKSDIDTELKIRQNKEGKIIVKGHLAVNDTTLNLSGLQLPKSHVKAQFYGNCADFETNLAVKPEQTIVLKGRLDYGDKPKLDLNLLTGKIFFNDMIIFARAFMDTLHINNNLASLKAEGYWAGYTRIKTDFKKIKSEGCIIARGGNISNGRAKLVFDKINANLILENNMLKITDTHMFVNGNILKAEGLINSDGYTDISLISEKLPLAGLFQAFAPSTLKKSISLNSGNLSVDAKIQGALVKPLVAAKVLLNDLNLADKKDTFIVKNERLACAIVTDTQKLDGVVANKNFSILLPSTNSQINNPSLSVRIDENDVNINPIDIYLNDSSRIIVSGDILGYSKNPQIELIADGRLNASGLRKFADRDAEPFISASGNIPLKAKVSGDAKKQSVILQLKSDDTNYITPVEIRSMLGRQSIAQAKFDYKGDRIHIRNTGLYTGISSFTNDLQNNMKGAFPVTEISGTIVKLDTAEPFINMIKLSIPKEINGRISAFKNSSFNANGSLIVFGKLPSPIMRGNFKVQNLKIPEILTTMDEADVNLSGKNIILNIKNLLLNGSDISLTAKTDINPHPQFTLSRVDVRSKLIDLDKLAAVTDSLAKYQAPPLPDAKSAQDIPVEITAGSINLRRIKTGNITAVDTTGRISVKYNNFFLRRIRTMVFEGIVRGNVTANLINMALDIKTRGTGLNSEAALLALAGMKDTLTGDLSFNTDIQLKGLTMEEQMKSLKGVVNFTMTDGQLGPFGKLENMILAENIRENQFFQTALGGVINNLATIDTSHFKEMKGNIIFKDGIAHINPIASAGDVMCLYIFGDFNLLENTADLKVRAKLGSVIANLLGPLAQLNPINLVQAAPGLNVVMAKTFFLFCEQLTADESAVIPDLPSSLDDKMATKFQIVLRGDVAKPFKLIKSFKWLALASEIEQAQSFVNTLPDPSLVEDPNNATLEAVMEAQEAKAKEDAKLINKVKRFFKKEKESI